MSTLLEKFFNIMFKLPDGRSMEDYYKSIALVAPVTTDDLVADKTMPENGYLLTSSMDTVKEYFKPTSQVYKEAESVYNQKANTQTTSKIKYLLIYGEEEISDYGATLDKLKAINTKFAQVITTSRTQADLIAIAKWCLSNKRFATFTVANASDLEELKTGLNNYVYALHRPAETLTEGIGAAVASTTTAGYFGGTDGSAQFTQLVGITPAVYTETATMDDANVAYYTNVAPVDGGGAEDFGYNWVVGSSMVGGENRQRMMIKDYIEKSLALTVLEFLNKKPSYDEEGNAILWGMLQTKFRSFQTYNLVSANTEEVDGFYINVQRIRGTEDSIQNTDIEAYNAKKYKVYGYYYDKIVGEKVDINLVVDPTEQEIAQLLA